MAAGREIVEPIPLTVIGGYLGAGKTTLLNRLLRDPGGRRLAVVVNDFGAIGIDAELLGRGAAEPGDVVNLANGCVCCTLGDDLATTLAALAGRSPRPDQVVIEASGVADPLAVAAWGRVPPFAHGGVIVLAAADTVRRQVDDRYVGPEVRRQLHGADLVVVTKGDLVGRDDLDEVIDWLQVAFGHPVIRADRGDLAAEIVLGLDVDEPDRGATVRPTTGYAAWSWDGPGPVAHASLQAFLDALPTGLLRAKGLVELIGEKWAVVDVVGDRREIDVRDGVSPGVRLVAIGRAGDLDRSSLDLLAERYCAADDRG